MLRWSFNIGNFCKQSLLSVKIFTWNGWRMRLTACWNIGWLLYHAYKQQPEDGYKKQYDTRVDSLQVRSLTTSLVKTSFKWKSPTRDHLRRWKTPVKTALYFKMRHLYTYVHVWLIWCCQILMLRSSASCNVQTIRSVGSDLATLKSKYTATRMRHITATSVCCADSDNQAAIAYL